jgi:hypothetical protein
MAPSAPPSVAVGSSAAVSLPLLSFLTMLVMPFLKLTPGPAAAVCAAKSARFAIESLGLGALPPPLVPLGSSAAAEKNSYSADERPSFWNSSLF